MIAQRAPSLRSRGWHGALRRLQGSLSSADTNPLGLQPGLLILVPVFLLVLGHLTITGEVQLPVMLPLSITTWFHDLVHADLDRAQVKLTGLLLLVVGTVLFTVLAHPVISRPLPLEAPQPFGVPRLRFRARMNGRLMAAGIVIAVVCTVEIARLHYSAPIVLGWLAGIALVGVALFRFDRLSGVDLRPRATRVDFALIVALMVFAAIAMSYRLGSLPHALWPDEGAFWFNSRDIAVGHWSPRIFEAGTYTFPVLSNYFQAAVIKLLGPSLESWRASSVLASFSAVPALYLLGRHVAGRPLAVGAVVLFITSPHLLAFSRLGYNNAQAIAPVVIALYLFYVAADRRSAFLLFLAAATAGLGFYTYQAARLGAIVILSVLVGGMATRWLTPRLALGAAGVFVLVLALVVLPLNLYMRATIPDALTNKMVEGLYFDRFYGLSEFSEEELVGPIPNLVVGSDRYALFFAPEVHAQLIGRGIVRTALAYDDPQTVDRHFIAGSLGGPLGAIPLLAGFAACVAALRRSPGALILVVWAFAGITLLSTLSSFPPQWTRLVPVIPAVALLSSIGIAAILRPFTAPWGRGVALGAYSAVVVVVAVFGLRGYYVEMPKEYPPSMPDVVGFAAHEPDAPTRIVAIYQNDERLASPPLALTAFSEDVQYLPIPVAQVHEAMNALTDRDFWLFFDGDSAGAVVEAATERFGPGEVRTYYDAEGSVIGGSYFPTPSEPSP